MLDILRSIILDFHEAVPDPGIERLMKPECVNGKATVLIGVRRCGKTTLLYQEIHRLLATGIPITNILFINFFDDRLHFMNAEKLSLVAEAYFSLFPEKKNAERVYFFFDEIQSVDGWEPFIDRLLRTENCSIHISGSSARMLSKEIATQMRGRALSWELFPFSFREYVHALGQDPKQPFSTKRRLLVQKAFEEYWLTGGFPEVLGLSRQMRIRIHQEYLQAILFRDLIERYDISHPKAILDLAHWLMDNIASLYSINGLTGYLKAMGHKVSKIQVSEYLDWLEDAYFLFSVRLFDPSWTRSNVNPKKIYCIDHAFIVSVSSGILSNRGHLLENIVFTALRREHMAIFYGKTRSGKEIDFVVSGQASSPPMLYQVCETLKDPQTRKREVSALEEGMAEYGTNHATLVTREEQENIQTEHGQIQVVPAWKFLLDLEETQGLS